MHDNGESGFLSPSQLGLGKDLLSDELDPQNSRIAESIFDTIVLPRRAMVARAIGKLKKTSTLAKQLVAKTHEIDTYQKTLRQLHIGTPTVSRDYVERARQAVKDFDIENGYVDDPGIFFVEKLARVYGYECFDTLCVNLQATPISNPASTIESTIIFTHTGPPGLIYHSNHPDEILVVDTNPLGSGMVNASSDTMLSWPNLVKTVLEQGPRSVSSQLRVSNSRPVKAYRWHVPTNAVLPDEYDQTIHLLMRDVQVAVARDFQERYRTQYKTEAWLQRYHRWREKNVKPEP